MDNAIQKYVELKARALTLNNQVNTVLLLAQLIDEQQNVQRQLFACTDALLKNQRPNPETTNAG